MTVDVSLEGSINPVVPGMIVITFSFLTHMLIFPLVRRQLNKRFYKIYMETLNNLPDECGCGTQASVYYMGHSTSCDDFKHVHERESHEVLLAILNRKKKLSFDAEFDPRHPNYESQVAVEAELADLADFEQVVPIPDTKETTPGQNNSSPQAMSMVARNVTSVH